MEMNNYFDRWGNRESNFDRWGNREPNFDRCGKRESNYCRWGNKSEEEHWRMRAENLKNENYKLKEKKEIEIQNLKNENDELKEKIKEIQAQNNHLQEMVSKIIPYLPENVEIDLSEKDEELEDMIKKNVHTLKKLNEK